MNETPRTNAFSELPPRGQQRKTLLRRLEAMRLECEQYIADRESFNDSQRSQGGETFPENPAIARTLAWVDQQLKQVRESR